jgi:protein-S-isoprenylcysteine O-methyltransferase Ste14
MPDNAGVRVPPPLYYALAILLGYRFDKIWRLSLGGGVFVTAAATVLLVGSIALIAMSVRGFRRAQTSIVPVRPTTALVVAGPYLFTRNPMYVGMAALTIAVALFLDTWWPILLLVPVLLAINQFVIKSEERYLTRRFGEDYTRYTGRVRRWL